MPRAKAAAAEIPSVPPVPPADPWEMVRQCIKPDFSPASFGTWFAAATYSHRENSTMYVTVPNHTFRNWFAVHGREALEKAMAGLPELGIHQIEFIVPQAPPSKKPPESDEPTDTTPVVSLIQKCPQVPEAAWCDLAREYRVAVAGCTEASDNYHFACFLAVAGITFNRSVYFTMARRIYPNFFIAVVGGSGGARKGTAIRYAADSLLAGADVLHMNSVDSREGLIHRLHEHQQKKDLRAVPCFIELEEFRALIEKSRIEGLASIVPTLANLFDCPDTIEKQTVQGIGAKNPTVAMLGGADPTWLERMKIEDLKGGMGNRILWIPGEPKPRMADPPAPNLAAVAGALHDIRRYWTEQGVTELTWDPAAFQRWKPFYEKDLREMQSTEPLLEVMAERMHVHCVKVAMLYAVLERSKQILLKHLDAAIHLVRFLIDSLSYIFHEFGLDFVVKQERAILRKIEGAGAAGITRRALQKACWRIDTETFNRRLRWLTNGDDGAVRAVPNGRSMVLYLNK